MTLKVPRCEFVHGLKCEDVSRRITSLEQERDSAREQLHNALDDTRWLNEQNDRLRELLRNTLTYIEYEGCGVECPETGHGATLTSCDMCNRYETESCAYVIVQSARELGIEEEQ